MRSVSSGWPLVRVPVLSRAIISASRSVCSASPFRKRTPISAARPVPPLLEVGVASPIAQGQAMIRTATALTRATVRAGAGTRLSHVTQVHAATGTTAGQKHDDHMETQQQTGELDT